MELQSSVISNRSERNKDGRNGHETFTATSSKYTWKSGMGSGNKRDRGEFGAGRRQRGDFNRDLRDSTLDESNPEWMSEPLEDHKSGMSMPGSVAEFEQWKAKMRREENRKKGIQEEEPTATEDVPATASGGNSRFFNQPSSNSVDRMFDMWSEPKKEEALASGDGGRGGGGGSGASKFSTFSEDPNPNSTCPLLRPCLHSSSSPRRHLHLTLRRRFSLLAWSTSPTNLKTKTATTRSS